MSLQDYYRTNTFVTAAENLPHSHLRKTKCLWLARQSEQRTNECLVNELGKHGAADSTSIKAEGYVCTSHSEIRVAYTSVLAALQACCSRS